jgi:ATP-dependent Lon protease
MLEVLDPEQNSDFYDNFLELGFDLSKVLFIATANNLNTIQPALLDRMEIINISGYSTEEKVKIAKKYLLKKQIIQHGLINHDFKLSTGLIKSIIEGYTRESGVRKLEKNIAKLCRSIAIKVVENSNSINQITLDELTKVLGVPLSKSLYENNDVVGVTTGLAWTQYGGEILFIESIISPGKGLLTITGNLGKVMKESATIAIEFIKANCKDFKINSDIFNKYNFHLHVPEGATPKDGPSAGITMLTSLVSLLTQKKVKDKLAMTGEITLRGKVLPVGGIKEKILAAKRANIKEIILSSDNKKNIEEIDNKYLRGLKFYYVSTMKEVIGISLNKNKIKNHKKLI